MVSTELQLPVVDDRGAVSIRVAVASIYDVAEAIELAMQHLGIGQRVARDELRRRRLRG